MSDQAYALLCQRVYNAAPDFVGSGANTDIHACRDTIGGRLAICFRGSKETRDWALDLLAVPALDLDTKADIALGLIHAGFLIGAEAVVDQIAAAVTGKPYVLTGHSLGGALALLIGALLLNRSLPPIEIVTFGAPRVGFASYVGALANVPIRQYRFGADPVPLVPTHPYMHAREPLIQLGKPLPELFANHHIENYIAATAASQGASP